MTDNTNTDEEVDTGIVAGTGHRGSDVAIASSCRCSSKCCMRVRFPVVIRPWRRHSSMLRV